MQSIVLPTMDYPFPSRINANTDVVNRATVAWIERFGLLPRAALERGKHADYGELAGRAYPHAAADTLEIASELIAWLFVADDEHDETSIGRSVGGMAEAHARYAAVVAGASPGDTPLSRALHDLCQRLAARTSEEWVRLRFGRSVIEYLAAARWESEHRQQGKAPTVAEYTAMRPFSGAVYMCFDLFAVTDGVDLPAAVRADPAVHQLTLLANNLIVYSNDILSFEKELRHDDMHNLVLVLWRERRSTLQEAVDAAAEIHERELASYLAQEERLSSIDPQMSRYKRCLRAWVKGNLDWSLRCARYRRRAPLDAGTRAGEALSAC